MKVCEAFHGLYNRETETFAIANVQGGEAKGVLGPVEISVAGRTKCWPIGTRSWIWSEAEL